MKLTKWLESRNKPDDRTLMIHKETSFSILSGLITQAPLVFFSNWFMLDVIEITNSFTLTSINIILLTIVAQEGSTTTIDIPLGTGGF